jgi:hypothetical protein
MVIGRLEEPVGQLKVAVGKSVATSEGWTRVHLRLRSYLQDNQEKPLRVKASVTVLKLTQVGEASSLRRSGKRWLRNSANWPRNFGIRGAFWGVKALGGHSKSALATVY